MSDVDVRELASDFAEKIMQTEIYQEYNFQKNKLKKLPELYERINDYRRKNFALQQEKDKDVLYDKMEQFEREYEDFRENPLVDDFLKAELAFCRMMQDINLQMTRELGFE